MSTLQKMRKPPPAFNQTFVIIEEEDERVPKNGTFVKEQASSDQQPSKKKPRIAYITYTCLQTAALFATRIFPTLDTWLSGDDNPTYYVVLNEMWKQNYTKLCEQTTMNQNYCSRGLQVLWTRCEESYFGSSPCCKMQQGLVQMLDHHKEGYDYFAYHDMDDYLARSYIEKLTAGFDASEPFIMGSGRHAGVFFHWVKKGICQLEYQCRIDPQFLYTWGQPVIYSRGALEKVSRGLRLEGVTKQCEEYSV
jgi:hypothetical protein